jgi:hypothetical protein
MEFMLLSVTRSRGGHVIAMPPVVLRINLLTILQQVMDDDENREGAVITATAHQ